MNDQLEITVAVRALDIAARASDHVGGADVIALPAPMTMMARLPAPPATSDSTPRMTMMALKAQPATRESTRRMTMMARRPARPATRDSSPCMTMSRELATPNKERA